MKEFFVCPATLASGHTTYSPGALKRLFGGHKVSPFLDFSFEESANRQTIIQNMGHISISGLQEKFSGTIEKNHIRLTKEKEQGTHILKPAPWDYTISTRKQMPINEHLTMQIASQVYGIQTAVNGLCFTSDEQPVYITRRFDIAPNGNKLAQEDFAVLTGRNELSDGRTFKYKGSYANIAEKIKQYIPTWQIAMEQFFRLVLFNYLYGNGDAHLKNFSLQKKGEDYLLTPAYDLLNTAIHGDNNIFGLEEELSQDLTKSKIYTRTGHQCKQDFANFGQLIGLKSKRVDGILHSFTVIPQKVFFLIENSFFNSRMKSNYRCVIEERHYRFLRKPDS